MQDAGAHHGQDVPRILLLKTGTTFPGTRRRFGDFDRWFLDALRGVGARFRVHDVTRSPVPPLQDQDGVIITGSPAAVYENPNWLAGLERTLLEAVDASVPLLAVCFGAQALAAAAGGRVARNPLGWEIGTIEVRRTSAGAADPLLGPTGDVIRFQATHQDRIEVLPAGATVLAENDLCPIQAFRLGARAWGVQFHPEATPAILEDLIRARRDLLESSGDGEPLEGRYRRLLDTLAPTPEGTRLMRRFMELAGQ